MQESDPLEQWLFPFSAAVPACDSGIGSEDEDFDAAIALAIFLIRVGNNRLVGTVAGHPHSAFLQASLGQGARDAGRPVDREIPVVRVFGPGGRFGDRLVVGVTDHQDVQTLGIILVEDLDEFLQQVSNGSRGQRPE